MACSHISSVPHAIRLPRTALATSLAACHSLASARPVKGAHAMETIPFHRTHDLAGALPAKSPPCQGFDVDRTARKKPHRPGTRTARGKTLSTNLGVLHEDFTAGLGPAMPSSFVAFACFIPVKPDQSGSVSMPRLNIAVYQTICQ